MNDSSQTHASLAWTGLRVAITGGTSGLGLALANPDADRDAFKRPTDAARDLLTMLGGLPVRRSAPRHRATPVWQGAGRRSDPPDPGPARSEPDLDRPPERTGLGPHFREVSSSAPLGVVSSPSVPRACERPSRRCPAAGRSHDSTGPPPSRHSRLGTATCLLRPDTIPPLRGPQPI